MSDVLSAINHTVPISIFNRGLAGKVFNEVKKSGAKVVMKNNVAECVLLSPEEYVRLMDELNDARLVAEAAKRIGHMDRSQFVPEEAVNEELGISAADLSGADEVELE